MYDKMNAGEKKVALALVDAALAQGMQIEIWNGGDDAEVERTTDRVAIVAGLGECEEERIVLWRGDEARTFGSALLIWGNSPAELVADFSARDENFDALEAFLNAAMPAEYRE